MLECALCAHPLTYKFIVQDTKKHLQAHHTAVDVSLRANNHISACMHSFRKSGSARYHAYICSADGKAHAVQEQGEWTYDLLVQPPKFFAVKVCVHAICVCAAAVCAQKKCLYH